MPLPFAGLIRARACFAAFVAMTMFLGLAGPSLAQTRIEDLPRLHVQAEGKTEVDLELVLAVDVSLSMDIEEQRLQRQGYVQAFQHESVQQAIASGVLGRIAVTYMEWAGVGQHTIKVPWTLIDSKQSAEDFADLLDRQPITRVRRTSISDALLFAGEMFEQTNFKGIKRVIDISGDGPNNQGVSVSVARKAILDKGIIINGLPIILNSGFRAGFFDIEDLDIYYEDCVIGGAGAFLLSIRDVTEFTTAIRRKLILEIAGLQPKIIRTQFNSIREPRISCTVGEELWRQWIDVNPGSDF